MAIGDQVEGSSLTRARRQVLADTVSQIKKAYREGKEWTCFVLADSITDVEEQLWLWLQLDAPERAAIKRFILAERKAQGESNAENE